jgi:serine/threonine-protein kinase
VSPGEPAKGPQEQPSEKYFHLFVDSASGDVDWTRILEEDPASRDDIEFLAAVDKIRRTYRRQPASSAEQAAPGAETRDDRGSDRPAAEGPPAVAGYELGGEIGRGGFATIYRATERASGRTVALKVLKSRRELSPSGLARFLREANALKSLQHPNILKVHNVIDEAEVLGLAMELIDGRNLGKVLEEEGPLRPEEIARIGVDLCRALAQVHQSGYVHRDIKAENVMREHRGRIVLMDFGLTRSLDPGSRVTDTGVLVGTPLAMAPEQYEFRDLDARSDIYALGCLLYRLATGCYPVSGRTMEELRRKVLAGNVPPVGDLRADFPPDLAWVIAQAMAVKPERRFQTVQEMESALLAWQSGTAPRAARAGGLTTLRIAAIVGLLAAVTAAVGLVAWLLS